MKTQRRARGNKRPNLEVLEVRTLLSLVPTTTLLSASAISPVLGQTETLTATVASVGEVSDTPTGTVTFYDGFTPVGSVAVIGTGGVATATLSATTLPLGRHLFTATFSGGESGDYDFMNSSSVKFTTVVGNGDGMAGYSGDGGPATEASINEPGGMVFDQAGNLFFSDTLNNVVREVRTDGTIVTVAGNGTAGYSGDGGPATLATLNFGNLFGFPGVSGGLAVDGSGNLFIADTSNNVIREVKTDGTIVTVAGNGQAGYGGDGGLAADARLNLPIGLAVDGSGNLFIADSMNGVIREVKTDGTINTAVSGLSSGLFSSPTDVVIDDQGNLYIADPGSAYVLKIPLGPNGQFHEADIAVVYFGSLLPTFLAVDQSRDVAFTDSIQSNAFMVLADGILSSVYPGGNNQTGIAFDSEGAVYIASTYYTTSSNYNCVIQKFLPLIVEVQPVSSTSLQSALTDSQQGGTSGTITIQATSNDAVSAAVTAFNGVSNPNPAIPEVVTLDLGGSTLTTDTHVQAQPGVTLVIANGTLVGGSPALIVDSGNVLLDHVTAQNATNAPTIVVNGGSLKIRNSVIQESTGYSQTAILITGGTVDLGTAADSGNNVFNVNGGGELIHNSGVAAVSALGDTFQVNGTMLTSGYAIEDAVFHALDAGGGGLVTYDPTGVYVTAASGSIQRGIDAVPSGGTVYVAAGLPSPLVDIGNKLVTMSYDAGPSIAFVVEPLNASGRLLSVAGTSGDDTIRIVPGDNPGEIKVRVHDLDRFRYRATAGPAIDRIAVYGLAGDDTITVGNAITIAAWLYGGDGNDKLKGGGGPSVLLGGAGDDVLAGASGRDILVGGTGSDKLVGDSGDDIVIAGYTAYDNNDQALAAIMAEWTSARPYSDRVRNLRGDAGGPTFASRANGNIFLAVDGTYGRSVTVFDDGMADVLTGGGGIDWFLFNADGDNNAKKDKITDLSAKEFADDLDFIYGVS